MATPNHTVSGALVRGNYTINGQAVGGSPDLSLSPATGAYPAGTRMVRDDGAVFRYVYCVAAVTIGNVVSTDLSLNSAATEQDNLFTAAAIGATSVTITFASSSAAADDYVGSYIHIHDGAGVGQTLRVTASTAASSNAVTFTIEEGLAIALTTASDCMITGCPWYNCRPADTTTDNLISGVAMATAAAADFIWVQTWGIGTVLADETAGTVAVGTWATLSDGVLGAAQPAAGSDTSVADLKVDPYLGYFTTTATDTQLAGINLHLWP